jgi:hypothetical protein
MNKHYKCCWCGFEFDEWVVYKQNIDAVTHQIKKKSNYSTKVVCPKCARFIPTWTREETGNVVGRKHIHIRK